MTNDEDITPEVPRSVPAGKKVLDMRNVSDPEVELAIKEILEAEWAPEGAAFDHEIDG